MKKLSYFITALFSLLLFTFTFYEYSTLNIQNNEGINLVLIDKDLVQIGHYVSLESYEEKNTFIDEMKRFADETNSEIKVTLSDANEDFIEVNDSYLYTSKKTLLTNTYLVNEKDDLDFTKQSKQYYSNSLKDIDAYGHLAYISRFYDMNASKKIIRYYPFESLKEQNIKDFGISILTKDPDQCIEAIKNSKLKNYVNLDRLIVKYAEDQKMVLNDNTRQLQMLSILLGVSFLLVMIQIFYSKKNAIAIRRLYGESVRSIVHHFFKRMMICNVVIYIVIQILMYMICCGQFTEVTDSFRKALFIQMFTYIIVCIILYGISILLVKKMDVLKSLSIKKRKLKEFSFMNATLKCCMLIFISAGVLQIAPELKQSSKVLWNYVSRFSDMKKNMQLYSYQINTEEQIANMMKIYEIGNQYGALLEDIKVPMEIEEMDEKNFYFHTVFVANQNYLENYELIDESGKRISYDQFKEQEVCFIPLEIKDKMNIFYGYRLPSSKVYYTNQVKLYTDAYPATFMYEKNPIIHLATEEEQININSNTFLIPKESFSSFMQALKEEHLEDVVSFVKVEDILKENMSGMWLKFSQNLMIFLMMFTCFYCIVRQGLVMYLNSFGKAISIRYLHGQNFIKRYQEYLLYQAVVYGVVALISLYMKLDVVTTLCYVGLFVMLDFLMMLFKVNRLQKEMVKRCLKGDEWK